MTTSPDYHFVTSHQINQFNMLTEIWVGSRFVSNQKIKGKVGSIISKIESVHSKTGIVPGANMDK